MSTRVWLTSRSDPSSVASTDEYRRWVDANGLERDSHRTGSATFVAAPESPVGRPVVVKSHRYPTVRDIRRGLFRTTFAARSRARREADNLRRLAELGLNPPLVEAHGERRCCGFLVDSFVATRLVPSVDLQQWFSEPQPPAERRRCLAAIGRFVGRLHAAGFLHRDLHLRNLLRTEDGALVAIDCSRGSFVPPIVHALLIGRDLRDLDRDLLRLVPEGRDRLRVLRSYLRTLKPRGRAKSAVSRAIESCPARRSRGLR